MGPMADRPEVKARKLGTCRCDSIARDLDKSVFFQHRGQPLWIRTPVGLARFVTIRNPASCRLVHLTFGGKKSFEEAIAEANSEIRLAVFYGATPKLSECA